MYALVYLYLYLVSCFCILYYVLLDPNEDIMTFRCGGGEPCSGLLGKMFKKNSLLVVFRSFALYLIDFNHLKLDY